MRKNSDRHTSAGKIFRCTSLPLSGHRYGDIMPQARRLFREIQKKTKRRPYIRSAYFRKDKIFFDYFWVHMNQKSAIDRARRLRYLPCALELMKESRNAPKTFVKITEPGIIHDQFIGIAGDGSAFSVVIKQERATGKKYLLSIFPLDAKSC